MESVLTQIETNTDFYREKAQQLSTMTGDQFANIVAKAPMSVRHGQDHMTYDLLKILLAVDDKLEGNLTNLMAQFIDMIFIHIVAPKAVRHSVHAMWRRLWHRDEGNCFQECKNASYWNDEYLR